MICGANSRTLLGSRSILPSASTPQQLRPHSTFHHELTQSEPRSTRTMNSEQPARLSKRHKPDWRLLRTTISLTSRRSPATVTKVEYHFSYIILERLDSPSATTSSTVGAARLKFARREARCALQKSPWKKRSPRSKYRYRASTTELMSSSRWFLSQNRM